ncbi:hypothetical protein [Thermogemmatispora sp.]|uniref:hypothetical protein n=1 Tax=Thermogemmatispora sp. TaxID=1968838 RepID=UPI001D24B666|nr:hypothetical protein [Thermogemmatispora sp.]MBX5450343.1 hypothetical protein [Thermogemmatispora sp.]
MIRHWLTRLHSLAPALASTNQLPPPQADKTLAALPAEREHYGTCCGGLAVWGCKL